MTPKAFENDELIWEHCFLCCWTSSPEKWLNLANIKKTKPNTKPKTKKKNPLSSAAINTVGNKEEREAVRGVVVWYMAESQSGIFIHQKCPNPGVLHTLCVPGLSMGTDSLSHTAPCSAQSFPIQGIFRCPLSLGSFWCHLSHTRIQFFPETRLLPVIFPVPMEDAPLIP